MLEIVPVPAFSRQLYLAGPRPASGETAVVDPGDAAPVLAAATARGWTITQVLEHPLAPRPHRRQCRGQGGDRVHRLRARPPRPSPGATSRLREGDERAARRPCRPSVGDPRPHARPYRACSSRPSASPSSATPCSPWAAAGCSRATPSRCTHRCSGWPRCPARRGSIAAHEYTLANARFAAHAEPDNAAIAERLDAVAAMRAAGADHRADDGRRGARDQPVRAGRRCRANLPALRTGQRQLWLR